MTYLYCHNCGEKVPVKSAGIRTLGIGMALFGIFSGLAFIVSCIITFIGVFCTIKAEEIAKSGLQDKGCPHCNHKILQDEEPSNISQLQWKYLSQELDRTQEEYRKNELISFDDIYYATTNEMKIDDNSHKTFLGKRNDNKNQKTSYMNISSRESNIKITEETKPSEKLRVVNTQSLATWDHLNRCPFYYFYYYVPKRYINVTDETINIRRMIYNFKDGIDYSNIKNMLKNKLIATFGSNLSNIVFVCIPASSKIRSDNRYLEFSEDICNDLGMINGYPHISFVQEKTPKHLGGTDKAIFEFDKSFFAYRNVVLFDDVVTRGHSMNEFINQLESINAKVLCQIAIGKTYNDWYITGKPVHPYSGNNALADETDNDDLPF